MVLLGLFGCLKYFYREIESFFYDIQIFETQVGPDKLYTEISFHVVNISTLVSKASLHIWRLLARSLCFFFFYGVRAENEISCLN